MKKLGEIISTSLNFPISYVDGDETVTTNLDLKKIMLLRHGNKYVFSNTYNEIETAADFTIVWNMFIAQTGHNISQMYKALVSDYNLLFNKDVVDTRTETVENSIDINGTKVNNATLQIIDNSITKGNETIQAGKSTSINVDSTETNTTENSIEIDGVKVADGIERTIENAIEIGGVKVNKSTSETVENAIEIGGVKVADGEETTIENAIEINGNKVSNKTTTTSDNRIKHGDNWVSLEVQTKSYAPVKTSHNYETGMNAADSLIETGKTKTDAIELNDPEGGNVTTLGGTTDTREDAGGTTEKHSKSGGTTTSRTENGGETEIQSKRGGTTTSNIVDNDTSQTETELGGKTISNEMLGGTTTTERYVSQGNQGVTMSQDMIKAELDMRTYNLYNYIVDCFARDYLIFA